MISLMKLWRRVGLVALLLSSSLQAHEGHDHAAPAALPVAAAAPRFAAVSESFELVGVLQGRALALYLDDYASNAPVEKATLELEAGKQKVLARESEAGVYRLDLADIKAGRHALVFTVQAGDSGDLLIANLDIPAARTLDAEAETFDWRQLGWVGLALPLLGFWAWRRLHGREKHG